MSEAQQQPLLIPQLVSPAKAANLCAVSLRTLQRMVRDGTFPTPVEVSTNRIAFYETEVLEWMLARPRKRVDLQDKPLGLNIQWAVAK